jgi:hypothetical protein
MMDGSVSRRGFLIGIILAILISVIVTASILRIAGVTGPPGPPGPQGQAGASMTFAKWDVNWRTVSGYDLDRHVGGSEFSSTFDYDWGGGYVFGEYYDNIGFEADMKIKVQRDGPVSFTIGSDDGTRLYIDGVLYIDYWWGHGYGTRSITVNLDEGYHELVLEYFDWGGYARVSFDCDPDVLMWSS